MNKKQNNSLRLGFLAIILLAVCYIEDLGTRLSLEKKDFLFLICMVALLTAGLFHFFKDEEKTESEEQTQDDQPEEN